MILPYSQSAPLERIDGAVRKIGDFLSGRSFEEFSSNPLVHDAVVWNLEIICDGSCALAGELKAQAPEVLWDTFADMGLRLRHAYEKTEDRILWDTIQDGLPLLATAAKRLLKGSASSPR